MDELCPNCNRPADIPWPDPSNLCCPCALVVDVEYETEQRIIKLLQEHTPIEDSYNMESSCHGCDWEWAWGGEVNDSHQDHIIRLIEGEPK